MSSQQKTIILFLCILGCITSIAMKQRTDFQEFTSHKNTIAEDVKGLDFIMKLRPVTYHVSNKAIARLTGNKETPDFPGKYDVEKIKYSGFLAQEVEQAAKAVNYDFSGYAAPKNEWGFYSLSYEQFVVPLVKAMQEQQTIISQQQKQIELLEKRLAALEAKK